MPTRHLRIAKPGTTSTTVSVAFSADESTVTITNQKQAVDSGGVHSWSRVTRTFYRPYVAPWSFTPTGTTYWVSTTGSDSNNGTSSSTPFLTIRHALLTVGPGDLVYVKAGTYTEVLPYPLTAGTAGNPIILSCAPKAQGGGLGTVKICRPADSVIADPWRDVLTLSNYNTINGLVLQGARGMTGAPSGTGVDSLNACGIKFPNIAGDTHCIATNCVSYWNTHCGYKGYGAFTIEGCISLDNGLDTVDHGIYISNNGAVVHGNIFTDNYGAGIHLYPTPSGITCTRNLSLGHVQGILLAGDTCTVQYNTFSGGYAGLMWYNSGCHDNSIDHNIFASSSTFSQVKSGTPGTNAEDYNCNFGGASGTDSVTPGAHDVSSDPLFTNTTTGDYRLQGGSPAALFGCYA